MKVRSYITALALGALPIGAAAAASAPPDVPEGCHVTTGDPDGLVLVTCPYEGDVPLDGTFPTIPWEYWDEPGATLPDGEPYVPPTPAPIDTLPETSESPVVEVMSVMEPAPAAPTVIPTPSAPIVAQRLPATS